MLSRKEQIFLTFAQAAGVCSCACKEYPLQVYGIDTDVAVGYAKRNALRNISNVTFLQGDSCTVKRLSF
jgi:hypothetical protein